MLKIIMISANFSLKLRLITFFIMPTLLWMPVQASGFYKWVDENGEVRYSDRLPPQQSKKRFQTLAPDGRVLSTKEAAKSPEQIRMERAEKLRQQREAERKAREEARIRAEQKHHDDVLMLTYSNEEELIEAEQKRLAVIDSVINLLQKNIQEEQDKRAQLEQTAKTRYLDKGVKVPGGLAQKIEYTEQKIASALHQLDLKLQARERLQKQYADDLLRYRQLTQIQQKEGTVKQPEQQL